MAFALKNKYSKSKAKERPLKALQLLLDLGPFKNFKQQQHTPAKA